MSLLASTISLAERAPLPDIALRFGVNTLVSNARRKLASATDCGEALFAQRMVDQPAAARTGRANAHHYDLPTEFFGLMLGPRRKCSACFYGLGADTLAQAEDKALATTVEHADLRDGQSILELGCGWGSLSLWMAEFLPNARITSVSNSRTQRAFIEGQARARGLANLRVITAELNDFQPKGRFDRVVAVEALEQMSNWRGLLERVRAWLKPDGRMFIHIFAHRSTPHRFDHDEDADWIGRYLFTGGIMPSRGLITHFPDLFEVEADWIWNGRHYELTALDWLANFDANAVEISRILKGVYGAEANVWFKRWRLILLATAGLFGHNRGDEWGVSHYRLKPTG
jgi:cyclopropane-fatty-acyl-phospholipid synthase